MSFKNFLLAHYEKLILAVLLIVFAVLLYLQLGVAQQVRTDEVDRLINQKEPKSDYQQINRDDSGFKTQIIFSDPLSISFPTPEVNSTVAEMMSPYPLAECVYCHSLIPAFNFPEIGAEKNGKCPVCGKELKPKVKHDDQLDNNNDVNGNAIPDDWEKKYNVVAGPYSSAESDEDEDGYTLFEEYKADTDPRNPLSHPLYVTRLYTYQISKQQIQYLQLKNVISTGTDKTKWDVAFSVRKGTRSTTANVRLNAGTFENNGISYTVVDIVEDEASSNPIVYIQPVGSDQKIECKLKQPVLDPNLRVSLDEMVHKKRITTTVGKAVRLGTVKSGQESYTVVSADPEKKTVVLRSTTDDKKEYIIPPKPTDDSSSKNN